MNLLDELTLDDLQDEQKELAEIIGLEAYKKLISTYAGSFIYICKADTITANIRDRRIRKAFNGYNYRDLAQQYNLSENSIRRILRNGNEPHEEQLSFFDN